jgi:hypothetical protein
MDMEVFGSMTRTGTGRLLEWMEVWALMGQGPVQEWI